MLRSTLRRTVAALALTAGACTVAGCSAIPDIPGVDVEVNEDGSGGTVVIEGEDGDAVTINSEVGGEVPAWFPADMPLPGTYTVMASSTSETADGVIRQVTIGCSEGFDDVMTIIDDGLAAAGAVPEARQIIGQGEDSMGIISVAMADSTWTITVASDPDSEEGGLMVAYLTLTAND